MSNSPIISDLDIEELRCERLGSLLEGLPEELKGRPQWLCWKYGKRRSDGKIPKEPTSLERAQGGEPKPVSHTDPAYWLPFNQAREDLEPGVGVEGIGFEIDANDPFTVVDLDGCRDPRTGFVDGWAQDLIDRLDSYTEASPSGCGVHIWIKAEGNGKNRFKVEGHEVEVYSYGRYMTVTGNHLPETPHSINDRQDVLEKLVPPQEPAAVESNVVRKSFLSDDEVVSKAESARNGEEFRRLFYGGDISGYDEDASKADAALVFYLRFFTNDDAEQIERLMHRSALARDKYDEGRSGKTWLLHSVIDDALKKPLNNYYSPPGTLADIELASQASPSLISTGRLGHLNGKVQAVSLGSVSKPPPRSWVVKNLIPEAHPSTLFGEGGNAKSVLALRLGMSVADPGTTEFLGLDVQTSPVLYLDFELDQDEQTRRAYDLAAGMGLDRPPADLLYTSALGLRTDEAFRTALETCEEYGAKLVIVDSIGPAMQGDAEASKDVLGFFRSYIGPLQRVGAAVLMVDHQAKLIKGERYSDKQAFGSVYKTNLSRSVLQIQGEWDPSKTTLTATLRHTKANFGPKLDPITAQLTFSPDSIKVSKVDTPLAVTVEDAPTAPDKILEALKKSGPLYPDAIAELTGMALKTVRNRLSELRKAARVVNTGNKRGQAEEVSLASHLLRDGDSWDARDSWDTAPAFSTPTPQRGESLQHEQP